MTKEEELLKRIDALSLRLERLELEKKRISIDLDTARTELKRREDTVEAGDEVLFSKNPKVKGFNQVGTVTKVTAKCVFIEYEEGDKKIHTRRHKTNIKLY
jgi:hypothetical protein